VVASHPTKDSDIGIEVWIPVGSRLERQVRAVGNGGFAGAINSGQLRPARPRLCGGRHRRRPPGAGHHAAWALGHPRSWSTSAGAR
jgi:hypothetical protein